MKSSAFYYSVAFIQILFIYIYILALKIYGNIIFYKFNLNQISSSEEVMRIIEINATINNDTPFITPDSFFTYVSPRAFITIIA